MGKQSILYSILGIRHKLYGAVFSLLTLVNRVIPHKKNKILIFDPKFDKFDNTGALYDYLIEGKYYEKYLIVNVCKNYKELRDHLRKNVVQCGELMGVFHYLTSTYVYYRSMTIRIKPAKGQQVIQMWHGPEEKLLLCGQPRTDVLFKVWPKYDFGEYKKLIIWTPTFRKYKMTRWGMGTQVENEDRLLPIIPLDRFAEVNAHLKEIGVKVVIKLHPMQSLEKYNLVEMDHFLLMSDNDFKSKGMDLYKFMTQCDAMITDYSSIYWDFLVLDRPIGFTEDDAEDYGKGRGFIMDDPEKYKPGMKLVSMADFYKFVNDLAVGIDGYKKQRKEMNAYGNPVTDGQSCKRALECVGITLQ